MCPYLSSVGVSAKTALSLLVAILNAENKCYLRYFRIFASEHQAQHEREKKSFKPRALRTRAYTGCLIYECEFSVRFCHSIWFWSPKSLKSDADRSLSVLYTWSLLGCQNERHLDASKIGLSESLTGAPTMCGTLPYQRAGNPRRLATIPPTLAGEE